MTIFNTSSFKSQLAFFGFAPWNLKIHIVPDFKTKVFKQCRVCIDDHGCPDLIWNSFIHNTVIHNIVCIHLCIKTLTYLFQLQSSCDTDTRVLNARVRLTILHTCAIISLRRKSRFLTIPRQQARIKLSQSGATKASNLTSKIIWSAQKEKTILWSF